MFHTRASIHSALLAALLGLGGSFGKAQTATSSSAMTTRLSEESEVPPVVTNGRGSFEANLNRQTSVMSWTLTYWGLSGPVTTAHFHGAATLTPTQAADLIAGKWYVKLQTAANPNGEIRGQLTVPR